MFFTRQFSKHSRVLITGVVFSLLSVVPAQVLTNKASPAVAQMRCSDGIVGHSLEKSEHYAPSPQAKRSRFLISKELWSLVQLRMNVKSSSLSAITSNARVRSVGGPRKCAIAVTKKGRSSPHP
jgi:hypothetical protein